MLVLFDEATSCDPWVVVCVAHVENGSRLQRLVGDGLGSFETGCVLLLLLLLTRVEVLFRQTVQGGLPSFGAIFVVVQGLTAEM